MFLSETAKDPSAVQQISSIIERYNQLVNDIKSIEELQKTKEYEINQLNTEMNNELLVLRERVSEIKALVDKTTKYKNFVGKEFKKIIKTESFNRLSRRIDNISFENKLSRDEFYRVLER